ncbi:hypothetical protein ES705_36990 [subsurface metagenome]
MNKKNISNYISLIAIGSLFFLFDRCVEPFIPPLDDNDSPELLVVEGLITDEPGAFSVRLTSTVPLYDYRNIISNPRPVTGAEVQITDDRGNSYLLFENKAGWYETEEKDLKGIPGFTYTLLVTTAEGNQYESSPVLMQEGPDIDTVYYQEVTRTHFDMQTPYEENWLNILVDTRVSGGDISYFKWEFEETWEFKMPTYIEVWHGNGESAPPPSMETIEVEPEKIHCWVSESSGSILIKSTMNSSSNEIKNFILQSIGPPDDRLNIKYSILVKQYVINRELYNFFKQIRESNVETGGIYQKTPAQICGNIRCCDGSEQALGYFMVSTVKTKRIFIGPSEHNVAQGTAYGYCGWHTDIPPYTRVFLYGTYDGTNVYSTSVSCTDCRIRGTDVKPDFWE